MAQGAGLRRETLRVCGVCTRCACWPGLRCAPGCRINLQKHTAIATIYNINMLASARAACNAKNIANGEHSKLAGPRAAAAFAFAPRGGPLLSALPRLPLPRARASSEKLSEQRDMTA
eukprot:scaffold1878_cov113-Isochrysis_galbana.AAC.2